MEKKYNEEEILFEDEEFFGDSDEHVYDVECFDGYGIATRVSYESENLPKTFKVRYPLHEDVIRDSALTSYVLKYRGLWDLQPSDITYGDIMISFGEIVEG